MSDPLDALLTKKQVAALLGVTARTIDNWCRAGILPFIALPAGKRFRRSDLEAFLRDRSFGSHRSEDRGIQVA